MIDLDAAVRQHSPKVPPRRRFSDNVAAANGPALVNGASMNPASVNETVPAPGQGRTPLRHRILVELGRSDLGMARLGAAHLDALAILFEGGREPLEGVLYGVWTDTADAVTQPPVPGTPVMEAEAPQEASSQAHRSQGLTAERAEGYWRVSGRKLHCCGAALVSAALVTADSPHGVLLFEVQMRTRGIRIERPDDSGPSGEAQPLADGMADTVVFDGVMLSEASVIGGPDWYRNRPGYWNGAIGSAACWAGGAQSLVDAARNANLKDAGARAQLAALEATSWNLTSILDLAGREIDSDPDDAAAARRRALRVCHLIRCNCTEVLERFGYATSPDVLAFDEEVARQHAALSLSVRHPRGDAKSQSGALSVLS